MRLQSVRKIGMLIPVLVFFIFPSCGGSDKKDEPKGGTDNEIPYPATMRKVACLGNSITYGARQFLNNRETECYPALLGNLLGENFEVRNFGCSGTTLLKNGNSPYWGVSQYSDAKAFLPNVVIIKFGTNDSRTINWPTHGAEFESDLTAMIQQFRTLSSRPKLFLCTPAIAYTNTIGASNTVIESEIIPIVIKVAARENLPVIDLHTALQGKGSLFPDGIHCGIEGNKILANTVYKSLAKEYKLPDKELK